MSFVWSGSMYCYKDEVIILSDIKDWKIDFEKTTTFSCNDNTNNNDFIIQDALGKIVDNLKPS